MENIQIGNGIAISITESEVFINGVKMPPCPAQGHNSAIIDDKVYLNGYELVNGEWKRTLKSLWYKWF